MTRRTQRPSVATTGISRAAVYHRVSSEEQVEGYSLDAQDRATRAYCGQIGEALRSFALPAERQDELVRYWTNQQRSTVSAAPQRATIERKLARLKEAYLAGDIDRAEWQRRQAPLARDLAALPADLPAADQIARRLAGYLADVAGAWGAATAEERNQLARALFSDIVIEDRTAVAVLPKPELRPFFAAMVEKNANAGCQTTPGVCGIGGSDEGRFATVRTFPRGGRASRYQTFGPASWSPPAGPPTSGRTSLPPTATVRVRAS